MYNTNLDKTYIAFLDILGFKELVRQNPHEDLIKIYDNLFSVANGLALSSGQFVSIKTDDGRSYSTPDYSKASVNSLIVSDSVLFWTNDDSPQSFIDILVCTGKLLSNAIFMGLPMRGSLGIGPLSFRLSVIRNNPSIITSSLFGLSVVNAYEKEALLDWSGCFISSDCLEYYKSLIESPTYSREWQIESLIKTHYLLSTEVPDKNNVSHPCIAVNWPRMNRSRITEDQVRQSFTQHKKSANDSTKRKISNTLSFLSQSWPSA